MLGLLTLYFCFVFRTMVGLRYVLMCIPLAYALSAPSWRPFLDRRGGRWAAAGVLASMVIGHVAYFGNPTAYTNVLVWPKSSAYRLMADSNIDWGQNDERVEDLIDATGVRRNAINPPKLLPGLNAIRINDLTGVWRDGRRRYRWLLEHGRPVGHYRHTYILFDLDPATHAAYLQSETGSKEPD
jgi:hypothetical protein